MIKSAITIANVRPTVKQIFLFRLKRRREKNSDTLNCCWHFSELIVD